MLWTGNIEKHPWGASEGDSSLKENTAWSKHPEVLLSKLNASKYKYSARDWCCLWKLQIQGILRSSPPAVCQLGNFKGTVRCPQSQLWGLNRWQSSPWLCRDLSPCGRCWGIAGHRGYAPPGQQEVGWLQFTAQEVLPASLTPACSKGSLCTTNAIKKTKWMGLAIWKRLGSAESLLIHRVSKKREQYSLQSFPVF